MTARRTEGDLWQLFWGALVTRLLAIAADLGVADALADGPRPVDELAREVGADPDALHRILRALASDGVFAEEAPGVYRNTEASEGLRSGTRWHDFAHLFGGVWHRALGELDAAGEPTFERIHGTDFWSWLGERPDERGAFDRAMSRKLGVEGRSSRERRVARGRARRRRRRRERRPPDRAASPPAGAAWHRLRPPGDDPGRAGPRRPNRVRRRQLLRACSARRCLRALDDPPRLGRRARGADPAHDPRCCAATTGACSSSMPSSPPETSRTARSSSTCSCSASSAPASATRRSGAPSWSRTGSSRSASRTAWSRRGAADGRHRRPHRPRQDVARPGA